MAGPTPEKLIEMALARTPGGRNNAGFWLAQQLHANGYLYSEAESVICQFVEACGNAGNPPYTVAEARATLKNEYRRQAKEPWTGNAGTFNFKERKAHQARQLFPTAPPARRDPEPDPELVDQFRRAYPRVKQITETPAAAYLESRGIPEDLAQAAGVGYAASWVDIGEAVVFPVVDNAGEVIAANGRAMTHKRYKSRGPKLLGVFITPGALDTDPVAVVEGPIDALSLALAGLPAIAPCGTSSLPFWLIKLFSTPAPDTPTGHSRTVYLAHDNDPPGEGAAEKISKEIIAGRLIRLKPRSKDWNEDLTTWGLESLQEYLESAGVKLNRQNYKPEAPERTESNPGAMYPYPVCPHYTFNVDEALSNKPYGCVLYNCESCVYDEVTI